MQSLDKNIVNCKDSNCLKRIWSESETVQEVFSISLKNTDTDDGQNPILLKF